MSKLPPEPASRLTPDAGTLSIGVLGAGQFSGAFTALFARHPNVGNVYVSDVVPDRAAALVARQGLAGTFESFDQMLDSPTIDAVAVFTQRWTHGPLVAQALRAGKHVYSAVPMASALTEIDEIVRLVDETGLTYMMGETSYYNPAVVYARDRHRNGDFGRVFYAEGDYVHDMDLGFYAAYQYSGGAEWKSTASFPPMLYPTHAIGGVLGALPTHAVSVSCLGVPDDRGDGVFDGDVSRWGNDFSNATALFELADGGVMRTNEMRRVGYPSPIRESRFRYFGTDASFEQLARTCVWQDKTDSYDISSKFATMSEQAADRQTGPGVDPALAAAFTSGMAEVHHRSRLPWQFDGAPNGHEGSYQFLADDFVRAVVTGARPPVDAVRAAQFTAPGLVAHRSALQGGARLPVPEYSTAERPVANPPGRR
ncbi:Gfo/Idh/MocA family protein [Spelaeicoccus albus]|uniref:Putative dehydrogenase n=1 Tax=Spelaeicoccus albus TaxID=1280376 RepID=A0A7Z0AA95_9MICO|nr:Gfo/Idh/MocA family oxidoreductase [Spelaeicoccus albus]NYI66420.1 putative dehydrogenase [Spelaeicoccus albus]